MRYALLDGTNKIIQIQPNHEDGFVEVPNDAIVGQMFNGGVITTPASVIALDTVLDQIDKQLDAKLDDGILWSFNQGGVAHPISLQPTMRETLSAFKQLLDAGQANPHGGYLWSGGDELRKPDGGDLSDLGIDEICMFAGQWALAIARISIQEKKKCADGTYDIQVYDATLIDWTVMWNAVEHPDWTDNLVLKNP